MKVWINHPKDDLANPDGIYVHKTEAVVDLFDGAVMTEGVVMALAEWEGVVMALAEWEDITTRIDRIHAATERAFKDYAETNRIADSLIAMLETQVKARNDLLKYLRNNLGKEVFNTAEAIDLIDTVLS